MKLYNTLSRQLEEFDPRAQTTRLYVCGITPYDTTHLGHAATYCAFDILIRYLEYQGGKVIFTENVTDIDDDTIREAPKRGTTWRDLGNYWTAHFIRDMIALNTRPPDFYPRATDVMPEIIEFAQTLIAKGFAYASGGSVYFHVNAYEKFGQLSRIPREQMLAVANERGNFPDDPKKRDPLDFVLWQAQAPGEPAWASPWGPGRPGWHIECSAMNYKTFGPIIEIHGGGADLVFPHHECEIAQTVNFTGEDYFARIWMHTAMVGYQGEKMSKSLGNLVMVSDLLKTYTPDAIRLYLAKHHYRAAWEFTYADLEASIAQCAHLIQAAQATGGEGGAMDFAAARAAFEHALDNDLDAPTATKVLCQYGDAIIEHADARRDVRAAQAWLRRAATLLGLRLDAFGPEAYVRFGWEQHSNRFPTA
ncbi:MAG: cysteine--tRNA ligase [Chloroflexi bacterium UTCFX4]|jgi:L-cysteine:1D-myo-inositol 2-amino-2-deoxy-alpha-D-glucopyranoside ligase|nr:MAG: cysteine--tRNA ligase [Chloroflexi bacterium UTCFX4]